ncbi:hypothetical protein [Enterococcus phage TJE2]|uniref:Uncharacterized protein n=14 Tax=Schiekvirus TaxID=2732968 RepID=A0AAE9FLN6_9CAUD|nr:membrane protein [Enterococcus phage EFDG1]YP_009788418.1 membrane protein [Enterococcus phage EFP01]QEP29477.1 membrane protein [Enterococcus phage PEf771]QNL29430.1 hypothetical protein iF6_71 [Enterococcus phage iF6]QNL31165.1 putative transmembrane protein [Enterococcus phage vB_EfaM_A2]QOV05840.1 hypothetical protein [Enterococcus phage EFGrKN]QVW54588.1 putative transmembrane protein [Enterococcus phage 113]QYS24639.1 hypothetical protein [Enterococcus phage GVEsP-1]UKM17455.1 hypo
MYRLAFIAMLLLQLFVYSASYYVTRAIQYKKLQADLSPLASYKYLLILYGLSVGSVVMLFIGLYTPIIYLVGCILGIGGYMWFSN